MSRQAFGDGSFARVAPTYGLATGAGRRLIFRSRRRLWRAITSAGSIASLVLVIALSSQGGVSRRPALFQPATDFYPAICDNVAKPAVCFARAVQLKH